jgi:hypothetical protein
MGKKWIVVVLALAAGSAVAGDLTEQSKYNPALRGDNHLTQEEVKLQGGLGALAKQRRKTPTPALPSPAPSPSPSPSPSPKASS